MVKKENGELMLKEIGLIMINSMMIIVIFFVGTYDEDGEKILVNVKDFGGLSTLDPNQVAIYQMDKKRKFYRYVTFK